MTMPVTDVASLHFQGATEALTVLSHSEPRLVRAARFPPVMGMCLYVCECVCMYVCVCLECLLCHLYLYVYLKPVT